MTPNLGLDDDQRAAALGVLAVLLADEAVLAARTRNYRWNVVGPQFRELVAFFGAQQRELEDVLDGVAGRCRALGGLAPGTLAEYIREARLTEAPGRQPAPRDMIADLLDGHEAVVRQLRAAGPLDAGTGHFLAGLIERHERMAGLLRAFLETPHG